MNTEAQQQLMEKNLQEGVAGFFIGGSSEECFLLFPEERVKSFEVESTYLSRAEAVQINGHLLKVDGGLTVKAAQPEDYMNHEQEVIL